MRKIALLLVLLSLGTFPAAGKAQDGGIQFVKVRQFTIPLDYSSGKENLKQSQLFVSSDQGRTWLPYGTAPPTQRGFVFSTDRDGCYWFVVQSENRTGRLMPASLDGVQPSLKVVIDTKPPVVTLQAQTPRGNEVGVSWDIQDENPELFLADAVRLEYRQAGNTNWIPLPVTPQLHQYYWNPQTTALVEVRLRARDRAGNVGEATTTVTLGGGGNGNVPTSPNLSSDPQPVERPVDVLNPPSDSERKFINTKRIVLSFDLKDVGPSGVSGLDLYFTLDGRGWTKYPHVRVGDDQKSVSFEVAGEGLYGFSLLARSGVGLAERPPQVGDRPQVWIEVDTTKPLVKLHNVIVGQGLAKGKVTILWSARDKNLQREPITISYAQQQSGPWLPIAQKLANTGRYVWTLPPEVPYQFYVKVEAEDLAHNVGEEATAEKISVDLSLPKVVNLQVTPGR